MRKKKSSKNSEVGMKKSTDIFLETSNIMLNLQVFFISYLYHFTTDHAMRILMGGGGGDKKHQ